MHKLRGLARQHQTVMRYGFVGGLAFAIEYGSFFVFFTALSWSVIPANVASFLLGLVTSFTLQRYWTFRHPSQIYSKSVPHQFTLYAILAGVNLLISTVLIKLLQHAGLDPRLGKIAIMFLIISWNYYIFNKTIFIKKRK